MDQSSSNIRNNQNHNRPVSPSQLLSSSSSFSPYITVDSLRRRRTPNFHSQYPQLGNRPNQNHGWPQFHASSSQAVPATPPPPLVEHQKAAVLQALVNLKKQTIRLEVDEQNPDTHLVTFTFDAMADGSITVIFFAKEGENGNLMSTKESLEPVTVSFKQGFGQKFRQPSGTGIELASFDELELQGLGDMEVFPLAVKVETSPSDDNVSDAGTPMPGTLNFQITKAVNSRFTKAVFDKKESGKYQLRVVVDMKPSHVVVKADDNESDDNVSDAGTPMPGTLNSQITKAVIEKKESGEYQLRVVERILWVNNERRWVLHDIYGGRNSVENEPDANDPGKECVICCSKPRDTTVLPCRHMCMCSECAEVLKFQTNKCPMCRQPAELVLKIPDKSEFLF